MSANSVDSMAIFYIASTHITLQFYNQVLSENGAHFIDCSFRMVKQISVLLEFCLGYYSLKMITEVYLLFVEADYRFFSLIFVEIVELYLLFLEEGYQILKKFFIAEDYQRFKLFFDEEENHVSILFVIGRKFSFLYQLKLIESNSIRLIFTETGTSSTDFFLPCKKLHPSKETNCRYLKNCEG